MKVWDDDGQQGDDLIDDFTITISENGPHVSQPEPLALQGEQGIANLHYLISS